MLLKEASRLCTSVEPGRSELEGETMSLLLLGR